MRQKKPKITLPPLSVEALQDLNSIEAIIAQEIRRCRDTWDDSFNLERAIRHFRSLSPRAFTVQCGDYNSVPDFDLRLMPEVARQTVEALLSAIPRDIKVTGRQISKLRRASLEAIQQLLDNLTRKSKAGRPASPDPAPVKYAPQASARNIDPRRAILLSEYKSSTGDPSNRKIYTARNSGINKPEFYAWLRGDLPETSKTTIKFEKFLRSNKVPIPKNTW